MTTPRPVRLLTLGIAYKHIDDYLKQNNNLASDEKNFLLHMQKIIQTIDTENTRISSAPIQHLDAKEKDPQKLLNQHAQTAHFQKIENTVVWLNQFLYELKQKQDVLELQLKKLAAEKKEDKPEKDFKQLLKDVEACAKGVHENLTERGIKLSTQAKQTSFSSTFFSTKHKMGKQTLDISEQEKKAFSQDFIYQYCDLLGGTYYRMHQASKPLYGKSEKLQDEHGYCYAEAMHWADEIKEKGYSQYKGGFDIPLAIQQQYTMNNSTSIKMDHSPRNPRTNMIFVIDELLKKISETNICLLYMNLELNEKLTKHVVGIRRLPPNSIEFFDSNFGLFVFPDETNFKQWLTIFMAYKYHLIRHLGLLQNDEQPKHAKASLLVDETKTVSETTLTAFCNSLHINLFLDDLDSILTCHCVRFNPNITLLIDTISQANFKFTFGLNTLAQHLTNTTYLTTLDRVCHQTLSLLNFSCLFHPPIAELDIKMPSVEKISIANDFISNEMKTETQRLKNNLRQKIDTFIATLDPVVNKMSVTLLIELKEKVQTENAFLTTNAIVERWRRNSASEKLDDNTLEFIQTLKSNDNEISLFRINLARLSVFYKLMDIVFNHDWSTNPLMMQLKNKIRDFYQLSRLQATPTRILEEITEFIRPLILASQTLKKSDAIQNLFLNAIKRLNANNIDLLDATLENLIRFDNSVLKPNLENAKKSHP